MADATQPERAQARSILNNVLSQSSANRRRLLQKAMANPHVQPYLPKLASSLPNLKGAGGVDKLLDRLGRSGDDSNARGTIFEFMGGAALGSRLRSLSFDLRARGKSFECDGELKNGAVVSMKSVSVRKPKSVRSTVAKARKQLIKRTKDGRPAMLVIGHEPGFKINSQWKEIAKRLGVPFSVMTVNHRTGEGRIVFSSDQRRIQPRRAKRQLKKGHHRRSFHVRRHR